jgi:DNA topoisomerase-1
VIRVVAENANRVLGQVPETGLYVTVRSGRFGPYLQLGEARDGEKPKRSSLPKGVTPDNIDLERALALLSLPREVGLHPEDGEPIMANIGRYGPYVQHGKTYANLDAGEDVLTIGLNRAVALIADKKTKGPRASRFGADPGRSLGEHPQKGGPVVVKAGRYGPYVTHAGVNATLPSDKAPDAITLDEAISLIDARAAKGGGRPSGRRTPARKAASTARKPAASKPPAGKAKTTKSKAKAPARKPGKAAK